MSVLVVIQIHGDTARFQRALRERAGEFEKFADMARREGAIHHRFGIGEGFVLVNDEWESAEQFQRFFSSPDLQAFIGSVGADAGPPELTFVEAIASSDQF